MQENHKANRGEIDDIIKTMHEKNQTWKQIARALNSKGFEPPKVARWTTGGAASYALRFGLVERRPGFIPKPGRTAKNKSKIQLKPKTNSVTFGEVEDIVTSTLNPALKVKLIKLWAQGEA